MTFTLPRSRDDHGVAVIITALCLIPLMIFAAFGVDIASWYSRASYLQKSADAAALVHADWEARYLNIMAMNNVASSQATVVMATSVAYQVTTAELALRSGVILAKLAEYSFTEGFGPASLLPPLPPMPYCPGWQKVPIVGGIIFTYLKTYAVATTEYWQLLLGVVLVLLVMLLPTGIVGAISAVAGKLWPREKSS